MKTKASPMDDRLYIGAITVDKYPRELKLSEAQRPKYYEWDGTTIKSKSKKLLQKYINQDYREDIILNNGNVKPAWLKEGYKIVGFKGNIFLCIVTPDGKEDCWTVLTDSQLKKPTKYFLCEEYEDGMVTYSMMYRKVVANETQAGKPKIKIITGQDFHVGLNPHIRTKLVDKLHEYYYNEFKVKKSLAEVRRVLNENYPVIIEMEIRDTVKSQFDRTKEGNGTRWDVGNRALPYMKTFLDFMTNGYKEIRPFFVDDDRLHISSGNNSFFTPIEEWETRQLVFHIYKDNRPVFDKYLEQVKEKLKP